MRPISPSVSQDVRLEGTETIQILGAFEMASDGKSSSVECATRSDLHEVIRHRAEKIYVQRGRMPGHDVENWAEAEREILDELNAHSRRHAVVIKVNGSQYVGEYSMEQSGNYAPGEFDAGGQVWVRFEGEKMYVKRPNGEELQTTVVKKIG
jgi:Protein of unknown function (DUF2934)